MKRDEILQRLAAHKEQLAGFGVKSLALFGSVVRGEAQPDSDLDFLVEFEGAITFDQYMNLKFFLEELLGRPVDLVSHKALKPRLRPYIEREAVYVP